MLPREVEREALEPVLFKPHEILWATLEVRDVQVFPLNCPFVPGIRLPITQLKHVKGLVSEGAGLGYHPPWKALVLPGLWNLQGQNRGSAQGAHDCRKASHEGGHPPLKELVWG